MFKQESLFDLINTSTNVVKEKQVRKRNEHEKQIIELINKRRRQILVHSCIYYRLNDSLIDDYYTYDKWSRELENLQNMYPDLLEDCIYKEDFKNYSSATGYDFQSLGDPRILNRAIKLLRYTKKNI